MTVPPSQDDVVADVDERWAHAEPVLGSAAAPGGRGRLGLGAWEAFVLLRRSGQPSAG